MLVQKSRAKNAQSQWIPITARYVAESGFMNSKIGILDMQSVFSLSKSTDLNPDNVLFQTERTHTLTVKLCNGKLSPLLLRR